MIELVAAAIMEALPMPAPMEAHADGRNPSGAMTPARTDTQSAPKTVPQTYMPITPWPSGESRPKRSGNNGDVGFSVNGVARANRFAFHADEERHRQTKDQRAEEVAEFLHDQRPAGLHDHFNIRTDVQRDLRDQQKNAHREHLAGSIHFIEPHNTPARKAHQCTKYECIKQRQKHD